MYLFHICAIKVHRQGPILMSSLPKVEWTGGNFYGASPKKHLNFKFPVCTQTSVWHAKGKLSLLLHPPLRRGLDIGFFAAEELYQRLFLTLVRWLHGMRDVAIDIDLFSLIHESEETVLIDITDKRCPDVGDSAT